VRNRREPQPAVGKLSQMKAEISFSAGVERAVITYAVSEFGPWV